MKVIVHSVTYSCPRCGRPFLTQQERDLHYLSCGAYRLIGMSARFARQPPFALRGESVTYALLGHLPHGKTRSCLFSYLVISWYVIMAKKNNTKRKLVGLVSEESGVRAYYTKKNTMNTPDKLSLKKYDPVLRKHVVFTETKKNLGRNEVKEKKR